MLHFITQESANDEEPTLNSVKEQILPTPPPAKSSRKTKNLKDVTASFLTHASAARQRKPDESDSFGFLTANKLRQMREKQRQLAECLLRQVLNKGVKGIIKQQTHLSDYKSPQPPPPQPPHHHDTQWQYPETDRHHQAWSQNFHYTHLQNT